MLSIGINVAVPQLPAVDLHTTAQSGFQSGPEWVLVQDIAFPMPDLSYNW